ncbi:PleD family two-component system response regulator [Sulfitobacter aestuarii]|uniref:PleD family two-component system response regulator n=1 Tax=Sulfitobacter aestuarii TaxID=2161676 RepID=A0ABW5U2G2_9RHOB
MRILAVDDDPFIRDLLPVVFEQAKFPDVTIAESGAAALSLLDTSDEAFDCLVLDIQMPRMDGITLCSHIRALNGYRETPIIMLTANTDLTSIEKAFVAGANDYVTKPFDVKEISNRVRIAERLLNAADGFPELDPTLAGPAQATPGAHDFALTDPIRLTNVAQVVLPFSLGNYLSQLSRKHLDACQVFAVRIDHLEPLFESTTTAEFARALAASAEAIVQVVECAEMLMAYDGNGIFMCIAPTDSLPAWPQMEDQINALLAESGLAFDDGRAMKICVSAGGPMQPNASRTQRVRKTFDRALARVSMRQRVKYPEADNEKNRPRLE